LQMNYLVRLTTSLCGFVVCQCRKNHDLSPAFGSGHGRGRIYNDIAGDGHCDIGDARQQVAFVPAARAQSARELMSGDLLLQNNRTALVEPYHEFEFGRLLDWNVSGLRAAQDLSTRARITLPA
jgi:hypothetical protein